MLVIDEARVHTAGAYTEQRVLDWMRAWSGQFIIVGLAISGARLGAHEHTDLVVLTPRATIVMDVKGTAPEAREGVLALRSDGRWKLSGYDGDPLDDAENLSEERPFDRVSDSISALSEAARGHNADARVEGLVVIVPPGESDITVRVGAGRPRCGVVVAESAADLRAWFHRTANRAIVWSAEAAHDLLTDLGAGERVTVEDLLAEGFPSRARLDYLASPDYAAAVTAARRHTEQRKRAATEPEGADGVRVGDLRAGEEMVPAAFTVGVPSGASRAHLVVQDRAAGEAEVLPSHAGIADRVDPLPASPAQEGFAPGLMTSGPVRRQGSSAGSASVPKSGFAATGSEPPADSEPPVGFEPASAVEPSAGFESAGGFEPAPAIEQSAGYEPAPALALVSPLPGASTAAPESASARPRGATVTEQQLPEPESDSAFTDDWSSWIGPQRLRFRHTEVLRPAWLDDSGSVDRGPVEPGPRPSAAFAPPTVRPVGGREVWRGGGLGDGLGDAARRAMGTGSARVREAARRMVANTPSLPRPNTPRPQRISAQLRAPAVPNPHRRQQIVALTLIAALLSTFWILASACSAPHRSADDTRGLGFAAVAERTSTSCFPDSGRPCAAQSLESGLPTNY
ncbi:hypothetical protein IU449_21875 [Nocardia higoensis]|uniref:NERD domain-containing protein n=1 Tax=Nocardia higoensis TaxID=228599 RepID=A0ABS0DFB4_9NOCA|nr:hypothetical protein [Nocardia higoensis]MBF6357158.1 hypothetical protein [Nocardia higoensis]